MPAKILIFTSKTGGGHVSLAEALRDRLDQAFEIEILDPQPSLIHLHYRLVSRHALRVWAAEFKFSDQPRRSLNAHKVFSRLFARNVGQVLTQVQPDLVMTTYPFLTYEVTRAMRQIGQRKPFIMLFTDPNGVHQSWLTERGAEANFAPTREVYDQALAAGFDPARLHLTGWPVRGQFYRPFSPQQRADTLHRLGLEAGRFTVFLQGGGEGAARFNRTVESVLAVPEIQVILAAGTNQSLISRFAQRSRLSVVPFTKEIAPFMAAGDVVMGKAGPNMLFEAVTLGKPFIATAYIPGQEQANLAFIDRHGLGWVALKPEKQRGLIENLAANSDRVQSMQASVDAYRVWNTSLLESISQLVKDVLVANNI
jgi:UDP-N-acetylglucosamine:LPS N-acetylglucosamine transferase